MPNVPAARPFFVSMTVATLVVLAAARPARAGGCIPSDSLPIVCGQIGNKTWKNIEVARNWGNCGDPLEDGASCPGMGGKTTLSASNYTSSIQDWDGFRVDAGCKYTWNTFNRFFDPFTLAIGYQSQVTRSLDRRGFSTGMWVKVTTLELVTVVQADCQSASLNDLPPQEGLFELPPPPVTQPEQDLPSCVRSTETRTDPNTARTWNSVWYCGNAPRVPMYIGAGASSGVATGYMDTINSWFTCYTRGERHGGGNDIWYYSKGDRAAPGWEGRERWGYMPAVNVWTSSDPYPGIPPCETNVHTFADIDGDGKAERIEIKPNGEVWAWANANGLCGYHCTYTWASIIATGFTDAANVRFADINGDRKAEIIHLKPNGEVWAWANANGLCGYNCTYTWASIIATGFTDRARVRFADIDGDDKAEIIHLKPNGEVWAWANANGLCGYNCTYTWASIIAVGFTDAANVHFADIDGNGKAEIIQPYPNGEVWTWANANGLCGYNCTYTWASIIATGFTDRINVRFADVSGDERAEIIGYQPNGEVRAWANANGLCGYNCTYTWVSIIAYR
jgi:hypothetical protein